MAGQDAGGGPAATAGGDFVGRVVCEETIPVCVGERCTIVSDEVRDNVGLEVDFPRVLRASADSDN